MLYLSFGGSNSQDDIVAEFNYKTLNFLLTKSTLQKKFTSELVAELLPSNDERDCKVASELRNHSSGNCTSGNCFECRKWIGQKYFEVFEYQYLNSQEGYQPITHAQSGSYTGGKLSH